MSFFQFFNLAHHFHQLPLYNTIAGQMGDLLSSFYICLILFVETISLSIYHSQFIDHSWFCFCLIYQERMSKIFLINLVFCFLIFLLIFGILFSYFIESVQFPTLIATIFIYLHLERLFCFDLNSNSVSLIKTSVISLTSRSQLLLSFYFHYLQISWLLSYFQIQIDH